MRTKTRRTLAWMLSILMCLSLLPGSVLAAEEEEAPEIINVVNADAVVVACEVSDQWLNVIRKTLAPTGVKITHFNFIEKEI